jgi:hypothetical protein
MKRAASLACSNESLRSSAKDVDSPNSSELFGESFSFLLFRVRKRSGRLAKKKKS